MKNADDSASILDGPEQMETQKQAESQDGQAGNKPERKPKILPIVIVAVIAVAVIGTVFALVGPGSNRITKADYITSAMLEDAIEIDNLSTAEFVYNGIAEHYRGEDENPNPLFFWESNEPVDYRICYKATVKAGISMKDVEFEVDDSSKTVTAKLPAITLTSVVNPDSMQFIPESTDADMQSIFAICEADVEQEAQQSEELYKTAEENLQSVVEALTLPILNASGYTLVWAEGE